MLQTLFCLLSMLSLTLWICANVFIIVINITTVIIMNELTALSCSASRNLYSGTTHHLNQQSTSSKVRARWHEQSSVVSYMCKKGKSYEKAAAYLLSLFLHEMNLCFDLSHYAMNKMTMHLSASLESLVCQGKICSMSVKSIERQNPCNSWT